MADLGSLSPKAGHIKAGLSDFRNQRFEPDTAKMRKMRKAPHPMGTMGSICHFPRALPASIWGHCSQVLVFTSIWGTQKGCDNDTFRAVFPQHLGILGSPSTGKQGKIQNDKSTLFTLPQGPSHPTKTRV